MGRLLIITGVVLFVVALGFLFWVLQGPDNPQVANLLTSLHCHGDEEIVQWLGGNVRTGTSSTGGWGRETAFYCEDPAGVQRDVTMPVILTIGGGFAVPLLVSIICFTIGMMVVMGRGVRRFMKSVVPAAVPVNPIAGSRFQVQPGSTTVVDMRGQTYQQGDLPDDVQGKMEQAFGILNQMGLPTDTINVQTHVNGGGTLTERLQQLEEARRKGLIDETEYQRARQALLDSLSD